jgi:hypothetical protein
MSELALQPVADDAAWDALVRQSPQGTLFAGSAFLQAVGCPHQRWAVVQGQAVKAALLLPVSADGRAVVADDLVIHAGPMFTLDPQRQAVKRRHDAFEISSFVAAELARRFDRVELPLAPQVDDLRPFLWHAYHGETGLQYRLDLRYTSYVDVSSLAGVPATSPSRLLLRGDGDRAPLQRARGAPQGRQRASWRPTRPRCSAATAR